MPDGESNNFHGIYCFLRNQTLIVAVSADLLEVFRLRAETWPQAEVLDRERFQRLIDHPIDRIIGPAFIGYTDRVAFRPVSVEGVRFLGPKDHSALATLSAACTGIEWEHGGSKIEHSPITGMFADGQLVAIAGYTLWGDVIAHISVLCHPFYRGRGYGRAVVSRLTEEVMNQRLLPQYQTLEANLASMAVGRALGFERYATTVTVRFISS